MTRTLTELKKERNLAYWRHQISRPMRIEAPIFFCWKNSIRNDSLFLRLYVLVHKCNSPPVEHLPREDLPGVQSGRNLVFKALWVGRQVHQSTSRTPPTHGRSMYAIQNNSLFLGLYESVEECTSPLVKHLPRVGDPCMQSRTTPHF